MAGYQTFVIGSRESCDIRVDRESVADRHAELVIGRNGKLHLTDCGTDTGTFRRRGGRWVRLRQDYVNADETVRFGDYNTSISALLSTVMPGGADPVAGAGSGGSGSGTVDPRAELPRGRVRRSIDTGEVVVVPEDE